MAKMTRRQRNTARIRREIVNAAAEVLATRGLAKATMEEIATGADYAVGTLYNYFESKDALIEAVIDGIASQIDAVYDEPMLETLTFRQAFEWVLGRQLGLIEQHRGLAVALSIERPGIYSPLGDRAGSVVREQHERWMGRISALLERGQEDGELLDGDLRQLAAFTIGATNALFTRWVLSDDDKPLQQRAREITEMVLHGIAKRER